MHTACKWYSSLHFVWHASSTFSALRCSTPEATPLHSTDVSGTAMTHPHAPLPPQTAGTSCRIAAEILTTRSRLFFPPQIPSLCFFSLLRTGRWCASNLTYNQIHGLLSEEPAAARCGLEKKTEHRTDYRIIIWLIHLGRLGCKLYKYRIWVSSKLCAPRISYN